MAEVAGCFGTMEECKKDWALACEYVSKLQEYCRMSFVDEELKDKVGDNNKAIATLAAVFGVLAVALIVLWARNCAAASSRKARARQ